ncbi:hypothetical protein GRI62_03500 [Erythrobacter arachoides]|uniref:Uncharacterized protein n=1 Tax=Aurantiacibacter arachoides TaxID=1850444 RepID=A0A844ZZL8_9SPHN|nr:hypothetical protein [Aurantiacibacter arachoides]MXO92672.1 hypothetical protein [Aurantiacibacter arachoides]GGD55329.1 hypothetical protein GCM10011411_14160 [Aurantiacibacter arachoides]
MDFSSWQSILLTVGALALVTLIGVSIRLLIMLTVQQRRERMNRQINERLRTLIAAYRTLGGSFTGDLAVDPTHLRDLHRDSAESHPVHIAPGDLLPQSLGSDRSRRIRDAVEAALSDILLLGTDEQVRLADKAARDLVAGRRVHTHELVVSLRNFVRHALQLDPIPDDLAIGIPIQGPTRPASSASGKGRGSGDGGRGGGGGGMGGGMGGGGMAMGGMGMGVGASAAGPGEPGEA